MTTLLNFMNTAKLEMLTEVPGVTKSIAENIISARPFEDVDDCLNVKGVGKSLLSKIELYAEAHSDESENRSIIPIEKEAIPMSIEKRTSAQENTPEESSFSSRFGNAFSNFLRSVVRFFITVLIIVAFGAALYYGLPYLYKAFIAPVEQNAEEISNVENQIFALQTQQSDLDSRLGALEDSVETYTVSILNLEEAQATLESQLEENNNEVLLELKHEIMMTRILDLLARARLLLAQSNFGLAREDVQSASDLLIELQAETGDENLNQAIVRLDLALDNLPLFPVVAS